VRILIIFLWGLAFTFVFAVIQAYIQGYLRMAYDIGGFPDEDLSLAIRISYLPLCGFILGLVLGFHERLPGTIKFRPEWLNVRIDHGQDDDRTDANPCGTQNSGDRSGDHRARLDATAIGIHGNGVHHGGTEGTEEGEREPLMHTNGH